MLAEELAEFGRCIRDGRRAGDRRGRGHRGAARDPRRAGRGDAAEPGASGRVEPGIAAGSAAARRAVARREDERILRGRARYLDDIELPRQAHAAFVRSVHARARVAAVRAPDARGGPGRRVHRGRARRPRAARSRSSARKGRPWPTRGIRSWPATRSATPASRSRSSSPSRARSPRTPPSSSRSTTSRSSRGRPARRPGAAARMVEVGRRRGRRLRSAPRTSVRGRYALPRLVAAPMETRGAIAAHDAGRPADRVVLGAGPAPPAGAAVARARPPRRHDPHRRPRGRRRVRQQGRRRRRGGRDRGRRDAISAGR